MSKNFELLQRVAKDEFFSVPVRPAPTTNKARAAIPFKKDPANPEIIRLVQRLFPSGVHDNGLNVVSFSGMAREDRSSWICARAGEALATQSDFSICIVDANLWSPQLHVHLGAANQAGLAEALATDSPVRNFILPLGARNLWLLPAGLAKPGLYPSLERFRQRIAELRAAFHYLLVSAPALGREAEATVIGQLADGIVLIVGAHQSRRETVRRAKEQLEGARVKLLGAVLDQRTFPIPEKLYLRL